MKKEEKVDMSILLTWIVFKRHVLHGQAMVCLDKLIESTHVS